MKAANKTGAEKQSSPKGSKQGRKVTATANTAVKQQQKAATNTPEKGNQQNDSKGQPTEQPPTQPPTKITTSPGQ